MHKTMVGMALSFLMAVGGGAALANSSSGGQNPSYAPAPSSENSGSQASGQTGQKGTQANGRAPTGFAEEEVTSPPFTVEHIDKKNHSLALRAPDGTQSTVDIPPGTPGLDALQKGDRVQLDYFAAEVFGPGSQKANRASQNGSAANGSSSSAHPNGIGRVHNIRKLGNNGNTGETGTMGNTGNSGQMGNSGNSGSTGQENR